MLELVVRFLPPCWQVLKVSNTLVEISCYFKLRNVSLSLIQLVYISSETFTYAKRLLD